jgi:hypothetical protein
MVQRKRLHKENIYNLMKNPTAEWMTPIELPTDKHIGLYGRQSTLYQVTYNTASNDYQIKEQRRILLERYGWKEELIIEYFDDFAFSGTLGIGERVGITNLTEDIEAGIIKSVYVFLEDRLFRDRHLENVAKFARICFEQKIYIITNYRIYRMWLDADKNDFIEACKRAWDQFDTQMNKRMMPMRAYKAHGGYYDSRGINIGYVVDKNLKSPTYNRYVIYEPHAKVIIWLYRRFIELGGSLARLTRELEQMPIHFPWLADSYFNSKCNLDKVIGVGYRIATQKTLKNILKNNVYIGVWKAGDDEYPDNHPAIIDKETWETVQALLRARTEDKKPVARNEEDEINTLDNLIERPGPYWSVSIEWSNSKAYQVIAFQHRPKGSMMNSHTEEIHYAVVEETLINALTKYIQDDKNCVEYAKAATKLYERESKNTQHLQETINGLKTRHDSLYADTTDHTLTISKQTKQKMYQELATLETEITRLEAKLTKTNKAALNFPALLELMRKVREHSHDIPTNLLHDLVTIFTDGIRLTQLSPHMWEMCIKWALWGQDFYLIWQTTSSHLVWTPEEEETLKSMIDKKKSMQEIQNVLTRFSYDAIYTKCLRDYRQASLFPFRGYRLDSCFSLADYSVLERYNLSMEDIAKVKGITKLSKDQDGNLYYRRLRGKQERARAGGKNKTREDAAFFIRHVDIEELAGNVEIERFTSAP